MKKKILHAWANVYLTWVALWMPYGMWLMSAPWYKRIATGLPIAILMIPVTPFIIIGAICATYLVLSERD